MKMKNAIKSNLYVVVPALLLIAALISSVVIYHVRTEQYKTWLPTSGTVTEVEELRKFRVRISYSYTVDGSTYESSDTYHDSTEYANPNVGDSATIWYDPAQPTMASYHEPFPLLDSYGPFFIALPLSVAAFFVLSQRRELTPGQRC